MLQEEGIYTEWQFCEPFPLAARIALRPTECSVEVNSSGAPLEKPAAATAVKSPTQVKPSETSVPGSPAIGTPVSKEPLRHSLSKESVKQVRIGSETSLLPVLTETFEDFTTKSSRDLLVKEKNLRSSLGREPVEKHARELVEEDAVHEKKGLVPASTNQFLGVTLYNGARVYTFFHGRFWLIPGERVDMKSSIKLREGQRPLLKLKLPVKVLGLPFFAGASVGEKEDLGLHIGSSLDIGPSWRLTHRPNQEENATSLVLKANFGSWARGSTAIFSVSAEFDVTTGRASNMMFRVTPHIGDFSIRRDSQPVGLLDQQKKAFLRLPAFLGVSKKPRQKSGDAATTTDESLAGALVPFNWTNQRSSGDSASKQKHLPNHNGHERALSVDSVRLENGNGGGPASTTTSVREDGGQSLPQLDQTFSSANGVAAVTATPPSGSPRSTGSAADVASEDSCVLVGRERGAHGVRSPEAATESAMAASGEAWQQGRDAEREGTRKDSHATMEGPASAGRGEEGVNWGGKHGIGRNRRQGAWMLGVHSHLPIGRHMAAKFRWGVVAPRAQGEEEAAGSQWGRGLPVLVLDKISLECLENRRTAAELRTSQMPDTGPSSGSGGPLPAGPVLPGGAPGLPSGGEAADVARLSALSSSVGDQLTLLRTENSSLKKALEDLRLEFNKSACAQPGALVAKNGGGARGTVSAGDLFMREEAMLRAQASSQEERQRHGSSEWGEMWQEGEKGNKDGGKDSRRKDVLAKEKGGRGSNDQVDISEELRKALERATSGGR